MISDNIEKLITLYLVNNSAMTKEQRSELSDWISSSHENATYFAKSAYLHRNTHDTLCSILISDGLSGLDSGFFTCEICEQGSENLSSEIRKVLDTEKKQPMIQRADSYHADQTNVLPISRNVAARKFSKGLLTFALSGIAAVIFIVIYANNLPVPAGMLSENINAHFSDDTKIQKDNVIYANQRIRLFEGVTEILLNSGVRAVVEGPAEFELRGSNTAYLNYGSFFASVPPKATGFTLKTQNCDIRDIGTEFGVQSSIDGQTFVQMIKGEAVIESGQLNKNISGNDANILRKEGQLEETAAQIAKFARKLDSKTNSIWRGEIFNLADLIGGGDGFSDVEEGAFISIVDGDEMGLNDNHILKRKSNPYHFFKKIDNKHINCLFSSNGNWPEIKIATTGLTTNQIRLSQGDLFWGVASGASGAEVPVQFGKKNVNVEEGQFIVFTASLGITFDIRNIKKGGCHLIPQSFKCDFKMCEPKGWQANKAKLDMYVLIDGDVAFSRLQMLPQDEKIEVDVPIPAGARFLSLALCDGGNSNAGDTGIFINPRIDLGI